MIPQAPGKKLAASVGVAGPLNRKRVSEFQGKEKGSDHEVQVVLDFTNSWGTFKVIYKRNCCLQGLFILFF